ncbi:tetratricopeptide repeat protein [Paraburkholderia sp. DHOC27]|uniref:tetratricopeptide repeat protein n=1 Tax=Paraburkholderia sp. DHOC27 TaxID=2303330 RepID=UPI000E3EACCF|nr:tetratricopeptide repeat protein [Paraburkholderia sp. DHOC27]RFU49362.1 tetratricopeptide repeat protein [Paraburkholderia sp. DHOC27]
MKRAPVHFVFAAVALACAAVAAYDWMHLQRAQHINQAMAAAAVETVQAAEKADKPGSANARGSERSGDDARELKLAHAIALSKAGAYDAAGSLFEDLIRDPHLDEVGRAALFDLGNLYLREGMGNTQTGTVRSAPMIEEAKARYRTLLRAAPDDWDARYNLERALWLAPETRSAPQSPEVKNQHNVQVVDPATKDLP